MNAIVFDVDDTLYDQQAPFKNALTRCFPDYIPTLDVTKAYIRFRFYSDETFCRYISGEWTLDEMRFNRIAEVLRENGRAITKEQGLTFQEVYEMELDQIQLLPEAEQVLDHLAKNDEIQLGIITNGPTDHQMKKIKQLNLEKWIKPENMIISESSGFAKPDPRIFDLAADVFNLEAKKTLYVGDNYDNDVNGAKEAGWQALWFNHRERQQPVSDWHCDAEVSCFDELPKEIINWIK
ncbi:HAD family hydrolase [Carnobacterium gallinarum]|uniref:HAD family hydrolase n=1 Tax=Carnobacterium gallinarum TaxID=2749 RepID=UPI001B8038EC|nr:HAD family hydrolase [Carnobacterium gallinarum]